MPTASLTSFVDAQRRQFATGLRREEQPDNQQQEIPEAKHEHTLPSTQEAEAFFMPSERFQRP
eukprot:5301196-Karenia_brevis.AAC.1